MRLREEAIPRVEGEKVKGDMGEELVEDEGEVDANK